MSSIISTSVALVLVLFVLFMVIEVTAENQLPCTEWSVYTKVGKKLVKQSSKEDWIIIRVAVAWYCSRFKLHLAIG